MRKRYMEEHSPFHGVPAGDRKGRSMPCLRHGFTKAGYFLMETEDGLESLFLLSAQVNNLLRNDT